MRFIFYFLISIISFFRFFFYFFFKNSIHSACFFILFLFFHFIIFLLYHFFLSFFYSPSFIPILFVWQDYFLVCFFGFFFLFNACESVPHDLHSSHFRSLSLSFSFFILRLFIRSFIRFFCLSYLIHAKKKFATPL